MSKVIEVTVEPDGTTKVEAIGFEGAGCDVEVGRLADVLGVTESSEHKPEYHAQAQSQSTEAQQ